MPEVLYLFPKPRYRSVTLRRPTFKEAAIVEEHGLEHLAPASLAARLYNREAEELRVAALGGGFFACYDEVTDEMYAPLYAWKRWCRSARRREQRKAA